MAAMRLRTAAEVSSQHPAGEHAGLIVAAALCRRLRRASQDIAGPSPHAIL
jgi:hypothetical protein